jgi:GDP-mannose 6-dehydrogenase
MRMSAYGLGSDRKLNLSATYLRPGFAFGGSCLPKDVRALTERALSLALDLSLLTGILPSNERHLDRALQIILGHESRNVGSAGFSFKAGTDDLRESPTVELVERLLGKGDNLRIHDNTVDIAGLTSANRCSPSPRFRTWPATSWRPSTTSSRRSRSSC